MNNKALAAVLDHTSTPPPPPPGLRQLERRRQAAMEKQAAEQAQWLDHIRSSATALRSNTAPASLLYELSRTYFGGFLGVKTKGGARAIEAHVEGDTDLRDAVLAGLRLAVFRDDIPNVDEVVDLLAKDRMHLLGWPFLAGLAEAERMAPLDASEWTGDRIRKALAFYFAYPHGDYEPAWYSQLLKTHPDDRRRRATSIGQSRIAQPDQGHQHQSVAPSARRGPWGPLLASRRCRFCALSRRDAGRSASQYWTTCSGPQFSTQTSRSSPT